MLTNAILLVPRNDQTSGFLSNYPGPFHFFRETTNVFLNRQELRTDERSEVDYAAGRK